MSQEDPPEFGEPEFLGWYLLKSLKNQSEDQISRSKFLKLCCIADRRLIDTHDYDCGLPRYWYMYGELASEHEFAGRFYNAPRAIGWDGQQYIPKEIDPDNFEVSDEGLELILKAVTWTVDEFGRSTVEEIKEHQYQEHADNEFIRTYSELRWLLSTIDLGRQTRLDNYNTSGESNEEYLTQQLDEMMETYPDDGERYDEMKRLYLRWDDTVRLMIEQGVEYSRIAEFLDDFIRVLSKVVLRFEANQHISDERLAEWEADAADAKATFASDIRAIRSEGLRDRTRSTELDRVSAGYTESITDQIEKLRSE